MIQTLINRKIKNRAQAKQFMIDCMAIFGDQFTVTKDADNYDGFDFEGCEYEFDQLIEDLHVVFIKLDMDVNATPTTASEILAKL